MPISFTPHKSYHHFGNKPTLSLIIGLLSLFCFISLAHSAAKPNLLVNSQWLEANLNQNTPDLLVIDLRPESAYQQGHIPTAINLPLDNLNRTVDGVSGFLVTPSSFQALMEAKGISNKHHLVFYADDSFLDETRAFWAFDFFGHAKLSILDGGLLDWKSHHYPLQTATNQLPTSHYKISIKPQNYASKFKTLIATQQKNVIIVDARPHQQFLGAESHTDRYGHIPNAINIPWTELIETASQKDGKNARYHYKSFNAISEKLAVLPENENVILYCNGGRESSVLYFGLKMLGREASLYDGSWLEWSSDKNLPIIPPKQPPEQP